MLRFRVAVERGITGLNAAGFATAADATLADRRSWVGTGRVRLRQVGPRGHADFTVFLVTPGTRELLCGGHDRYTSCRSGDRVVINVARWVHGAAAVAGPLASYREYVINHEVGHRLGFGHERCPHRGAAAPVMQQQTLGLHGCRPNAWPAPGRTEYHGPTGSYDDPLPVGSSGRP